MYRVPTEEMARLLLREDAHGMDWEELLPVVVEAGRFASDVLARADVEGDREGCLVVDGVVRVPAAHRIAYRQLADGGWMSVAHPVEHGGGGMPQQVAAVFEEILASTNLSLSMVSTLNAGAVGLIHRHASDDQRKRWLTPLVAGTWTATMAMTEAEAGSDLAAVRARAHTHDDGYRLFGEKVFISYGDHDLTDQILHFALARLPDAPEGSRGLSLFAVPKLLGSEGAYVRNDVHVTSIERKVGLHASPTCALTFGAAGDGAVGELIGAPGDGLRQMFTMMNHARVRVALQGVAVAERALQKAEGFARSRHQGRPAGWDSPAPIIEHPDVRRMLGVARARVAAARCLAYETARRIDLAEDAPSDPFPGAVLDLLTPVAKAWCTDTAVEVASTAVQVQGGFGFLEEAESAGQQYRDARVTPIYEGTNGILAIDLLRRQIARDGGGTLRRLMDEMLEDLDGMPLEMHRSVQFLRVAARRVWSCADELASRIDHDEATALVAATPLLSALGATLAGWQLARVAVHVPDERSAAQVSIFVAHVLPGPLASLAPALSEGIEDFNTVVEADW